MHIIPLKTRWGGEGESAEGATRMYQVKPQDRGRYISPPVLTLGHLFWYNTKNGVSLVMLAVRLTADFNSSTRAGL